MARAGGASARQQFCRLCHLPRRAHARSAARLYAPWHAHHLQPGLDQSDRRRRAHRATAARCRPAWGEGGGGLRQPDHRSRAGTGRPRAGKRRARALARARSDQCRGLPGRRAYRRRLARRRADRGHRPRCRPVDLPGAHDAWDPLDHERVGAGSAIGHLLECGAQVTGGYFCDPGFKELPEPWNFAFPIAEAQSDGTAVITKVAGSGGGVTLQTIKEQMLYEVHDPANYLTPDVVVDFTQARLEQIGPDRVRVTGLTGKPRTPTLKVTIGCAEGFIGEDMFFYAGPGALRRARWARKILQERFRIVQL